MSPVKKVTSPDSIISKALTDENIPKLYANNHTCVLGTGDVAILFNNANTTVGMLNMSFTAAKSLALSLQELISHLETKCNTPIMTSKDIEKYLSEGRKDG